MVDKLVGEVERHYKSRVLDLIILLTRSILNEFFDLARRKNSNPIASKIKGLSILTTYISPEFVIVQSL